MYDPTQIIVLLSFDGARLRTDVPKDICLKGFAVTYVASQILTYLVPSSGSAITTYTYLRSFENTVVKYRGRAGSIVAYMFVFETEFRSITYTPARPLNDT